jgi:hypothetical protein
MIVIIDFDGTLTPEEIQAPLLARRALRTLSREVLGDPGGAPVPARELARAYHTARAAIRAEPERYGWFVNGLRAGYADEGAFQCNTATLQLMLSAPRYAAAVAVRFPAAEYDPVVDCTNWLFHRHTAELAPAFRPAALAILQALLDEPARTPVVLTNSLGDKVARALATLPLRGEVEILGDTRQYEMAPDWPVCFEHPSLGPIQTWPVARGRTVDLRRPAYHAALLATIQRDPAVAVVADTFSLPGALPLMMGIPFFLLRTPYTPNWCAETVAAHPLGTVLEDLGDLPRALAR